jgi:crossover junction endodeoxyribonuclease RusA
VTEIVLPWPPRELSPNARPHYFVRARATKAYRTTAHWATKAAGVRAPDDAGDIRLNVLFNPPSRRSDRQNYPGWVKAGIDGVADALGVNDRRFEPVYTYGEPVKGGRVVVTL